MTTGERIKEIRKTLNKDIKTFAQDLGVSYQTLTHYESNYRGISDEVKQVLFLTAQPVRERIFTGINLASYEKN